MREKDLGIWQRVHVGPRLERRRSTPPTRLLALGVEPGDRVSIHSEDRPEWVILDLATVAVRGITVGLYPTNPAAEVEYLLGDCGARVHLAEDQEQVDKVLRPARHERRRSATIIYVEPRGLTGYDRRPADVVGRSSSSSAASTGPPTRARSSSAWPRRRPTT